MAASHHLSRYGGRCKREVASVKAMVGRYLATDGIVPNYIKCWVYQDHR